MFSRFAPRLPGSRGVPQPENNIVASYDLHIEWSREADLNAPPEFLLGECRQAIEDEFTRAVDLTFGGYVTVRIDSLDYGSIFGTVTLVLVAGISFFEFVSKYKDFYDSIVVLRQQLRSLMYAKLRRSFRPGGTNFRVDVAISSVPAIAANAPLSYAQSEHPIGYSSVFFWYLFIMNLLLVAALVALAYRAIARVYFGTP